MRPRLLWLAVPALALLAAGCGDDKVDPLTQPCTPMQSLTCTCPNGGGSTHTCDAAGVWGPCACAGVPAATDARVDTGPDVFDEPFPTCVEDAACPAGERCVAGVCLGNLAACNNTTDRDLFFEPRDPDFGEVVLACGTGCLSRADVTACTALCINDEPVYRPLSLDCGSCFGDIFACMVDNQQGGSCLVECAGQPDSGECNGCLERNGCLDRFEVCSGF